MLNNGQWTTVNCKIVKLSNYEIVNMKACSTFYVILLGVIFVTLAACDPKPKETEVPYTELKHYFLRNDAEIPTNPKIDTQEQFDSLFGMARVMGAEGQPTHVDFERQFVIAVVLPITNQQTELNNAHLYTTYDLLGHSILRLKYNVHRDEDTLSYSMQPILLIAVDRQHDAERIDLCEVEDVVDQYDANVKQ